MLGFIRNTLHPARYHGRVRNQKPPFFEGWYYKVVDASERERFAIIPGVFWSDDPHAFIQVLDGESARATYHRFPMDVFWAADDRFEVHIGPNRFTPNDVVLQIDRPEQVISGTLRLGGLTPWPVTWTAPGIMGWYGWVPVMECYHGIISLDHRVHGTMCVDGREIDFEGGRGYGEKDWGRSFPEAYIWFQTNHFDAPGTCLTGSVAIIPWGKRAFRGFIVGFWHNETLYRFATYTGAKSESLQVDEDTVRWVLADKRHRLEITARRGAGQLYGLLLGPTTHEMGKRIGETLSATIHVRLTERGGRVLFDGTGRHAGLETYNVQQRLLEMQER